jgi:bifunctional DNA-binding transcriptional regulator/antitoxin component of YhaV-PrlF toxin-antitoxin module
MTAVGNVATLPCEATLTSRAQTTIPVELRERLDLVAGTRLVFTVLDHGSLLVRAKQRAPSSLRGLLKTDKSHPLEALRRWGVLALDTKVLVRLLVADDAAQARQAEDLLATEQAQGRDVLISLLVLVETEWVRRSRHELPKERIADAFTAPRARGFRR